MMNSMVRLLSIPAFSERMGGISIWTTRKWIHEGKVASVKVGSRRMIPESEVSRLIQAGLEPALQPNFARKRRQ